MRASLVKINRIGDSYETKQEKRSESLKFKIRREQTQIGDRGCEVNQQESSQIKGSERMTKVDHKRIAW